MARIDLPDIPGIASRGRRDDGDWADIARIHNANLADVGSGGYVTADEVKGWLANADDVEDGRDYVFVEIEGDAVAYAIASTFTNNDGKRVYRHNCKVHPDRRNRGIGTALLNWAIANHTERVPDLGPGMLQTESDHVDETLVAMLTAAGYEPVTTDALLVRPHLDDLPERPVPDGLEIRPVEESHLRAIYEAEVEAFKDHWGSRPATEGDWKAFLEFAHRDESMWKVAWDGDRVAGQVRGYVNAEENEVFGYKRGWCEWISTAKEWRGRGVASCLIVETLKEFRRRGLEEAALGVHVENPTGAYSLYTGLGFELVTSSSTYERPLTT